MGLSIPKQHLPWLVPAAVIAVLIVGWAAGQNLSEAISPDTPVVIAGGHTISYCLAHGILSNCQIRSAPIHGQVGPFALYQYIPTVILEHLFSDAGTYRGLELINLLAFLTTVFLGGWLVSQTGRPTVTAFSILVLTASPLLYFAGITFGEELAACLMVLFVTAALRRWPPRMLALTTVAVCLTKETMFPIAALLGAAALLATPVARRPGRRGDWIALVLGCALGYGLGALFNIFRYDTIKNVQYEIPLLLVHSLADHVKFAVDVWGAPNGGLLEFWPLAAIMALLAAVLAIRERGRLRWASLCVLLALAILTGVLADWYSPFGWFGWGPRLMVPVVTGVVVVTLVIGAERIEAILRWALGGTLRLVSVGVAVIAMALGQVNVLHAQSTVYSIFGPDATCGASTAVPIQNPSYYRCFEHYAWERHWIMLTSFNAMGNTWGWGFAVLFGLAWAALLLAASGLRPAWRTRTVIGAAGTEAAV